jgi:hypothetical protein
MDYGNRAQRLEELQLALSGAFASHKTPSISAIEEGGDVVLHMSWVTETGRDTTLDSRCAATLYLSAACLEQYRSMDTAQRRVVQQRAVERVREAFASTRAGHADSNECSMTLRLDDALALS